MITVQFAEASDFLEELDVRMMNPPLIRIASSETPPGPEGGTVWVTKAGAIVHMPNGEAQLLELTIVEPGEASTEKALEKLIAEAEDAEREGGAIECRQGSRFEVG